MTRAEVEAVALSLPEATRVVLFRGTHDVYKVRGKVFGICSEPDGLSFKATEIAYAMLVEDGPGRPAKGFTPGKGHWVSLPLARLSPADASDWLATSYRLAAGGLARAARRELGLLEAGA